jgi:hypothetical protein
MKKGNEKVKLKTKCEKDLALDRFYIENKKLIKKLREARKKVSENVLFPMKFHTKCICIGESAQKTADILQTLLRQHGNWPNSLRRSQFLEGECTKTPC